jgi:SPP1 family predicted phage head-tail adaptor
MPLRGKQIDPAELDRQVEIKQRVIVQDSRGDIGEPTLSTVATVWARKNDMRGRERFTSDRVTAIRAGSYLIRHRSDLTEKMLLVDGSDSYEIVGLAEVGRKDFLEVSVQIVTP